jgi:hypothetical protein
MSTPLGEKTLATMPIPLDHLAAHLDPGYERLAANEIVPHAISAASPEHLVQLSGASMRCSLIN